MSEQPIYGLHAVAAVLANPHRRVQKLIINPERTDKRIEELIEISLKANIKIEKLTIHQMNARFPDFVHQGVVAVALPVPSYNDSHLLPLLEASKKPSLILILDGITDPHNLGACLRCADASGVDFVVIPKDKSASITPIVSKVACGAAESVPLVRVTNLARAMEVLKNQGVWIYGATHEASNSLYSLDCLRTIAIVMGAEGEGLRQLTKKNCDVLFSLIMLGSVESLNVSVATGISLYEVIRQRQGNI